MPRQEPMRSEPSATLTPAEREWIRRQGLTARALAAEQRRVRERMSAAVVEQKRRFTRPPNRSVHA
jgi:hypothetical protein